MSEQSTEDRELEALKALARIGEKYGFGDPKFIGRSYVLEDTVIYINGDRPRLSGTWSVV
jgi:hypothetical protein